MLLDHVDIAFDQVIAFDQATNKEAHEDSPFCRSLVRLSLDGASEGETFHRDALSLSWQRRGEELALHLVPRVPLTLHSCVLTCSHDFSDEEKVLFNGWQSWTDTHEVDPRARLRGLEGTPQALIDTWFVDASGDYRFTEYANKPGVRHGWTFAYLTARKQASRCLLVASLDERNGFTKLAMDYDKQAFTITPEVPLESVAAGQEVTLLRLAFIEAPTPDQAFAHWFALQDMSARPAPLLTGYSSWYRHYDDISEETLSYDLASCEATFKFLNTEGFQRLYQIDDGYCLVGDWLSEDKEKFPVGLSPLVEKIRAAGFLPGLWMAPFVCEADSALFAQHPDWLLRDTQGNAVRAGSHWSGSYALDSLNPEVRHYVRTCVQSMVEQGFDLLKLDFLYAACMLPHGGDESRSAHV